MSTIICIDFGTSLTKVAASLDGGMPVAIPIGEIEGDPLRQHAINSSLLFAKDGNVYVGRLAVDMSFAWRDDPQRRLDSLKRWLLFADQPDLAKTRVPPQYNRTGVNFTIAESLSLFLAHVLALTRRHLRDEHSPEVLDAVTYRFTRPVFARAQAQWADDQLSSTIARALLLEKMLHGTSPGKFEARAARAALDGCRSEAAPLSGIERPGLEEPIAAGVVQLSELFSHRSLAVIVDIGAGTTDMAVFVAVQPDGRKTIDRAKVLGAPASIAMAGDHLDDALREMIEEGCEFTLSERDRVEIELNIRRWKEDIFNLQETVPILSGGRVLNRILLHRFEQSPKYVAMQKGLTRTLLEVLESAERWLDFYASVKEFPHSEIEVIPSGGGANLPMLKTLDSIRWETRPSHRVLRVSVKKPVRDASWGYEEGFSQLTVALGGAFEERPRVVGGIDPSPVRRSPS